MAEFLLEIGFEEMPAPWLAGLADQLRSGFETLAGNEQLDPSEPGVWWTSRRLVLSARVKERQEDRAVVEWGPAAKIARDAAGNWTKAAEGFARKHGVDLDGLAVAARTEGGDDLYLRAEKRIAGRPAKAVLESLLPPLLRRINFPKRMNWDAWLDDGKGAFEFGRPIQWLVSLLDGEVVPLTIFDAVAGAKGGPRVIAGRRSMGHRFYPREARDRGFEMRNVDELRSGLEARFVILDPEKRKERIRGQVEAAGGQVSAETEPLLSEWSDLVEYPTVVVGTIPAEFGDLPGEVLRTVLAHHQKAIPLPRAADGSPRFAAISGGDESAARNAALGQERVIAARLKDARFFYDEDRRHSLDGRLDQLRSVTFHRGLGNYRDKAERVQALVQALAADVALAGPVARAAARAALLAKADLVTLMVREFPELQGTMGGLYAEGEGAVVADAIRHHYEPVSVEQGSAPFGQISGDSLAAFALVGFADKLDTLVGYFGLGLVPSGSSDPYGLRRAGQGAIRILLDFWPGNPPDLGAAIERSRGLYGASLSKPAEEIASTLRSFLVDRLRGVLAARELGASDEIDSVIGARVDPLADIPAAAARLVALSTVRSEQRKVFEGLAEAFKRARNIAGDRDAASPDESAFVEQAERDLHAAVRRAEETRAGDPAARLRAVASLRPQVDAFFGGVMVMADDPRLRTNRLALLTSLLNLVYEVADLSRLASPAGERAASS